jgi:DNA-directed RNA polymerase specialized sigma24 family protein
MTNNLACTLFHRCLDDKAADEPWYQFQQRYGRYLKGVVCRTARRNHGHLSEHEIEELLQELFCRVLAGRRPCVLDWSDRQLWAYLSQITFRLLVDRHRHRLRQKKSFRLIRGMGSKWFPSRFAVDNRPSPEELVLRQDGWRQLDALAAQVVRPDRRSLELRGLRMALLEGYSSREIAQLTGGRLKGRRVDRLVFCLRKKLLAAGLALPPRRSASREAVLGVPGQGSKHSRRRRHK